MDSTEQESLKIVGEHISSLMEHFESVQVLCSRHNPSIGTENVYLGAGNWFARQGMAHDFINQDKSRTEASEIAKAMPNKNDEN